MEVNWLLSVFLFSSEKLLFDWPTILNSKHGIRDNETAQQLQITQNYHQKTLLFRF
jgi:hypothetical protein